jgi:hypothetical protein
VIYLVVSLCSRRVYIVDTRKLDLEQVYQHIVILVQYVDKFGAFGISCWPKFGSKDVKFDRFMH